MPRFDTVVKNGMIIDGTRAPRYRGDIGIKDGRIAELGKLDAGDGASEIDASGLVVAPGFIDLHTHYDAQVFFGSPLLDSGWHGVTSVEIGNCGFSFAPVRPEQRHRRARDSPPFQRSDGRRRMAVGRRSACTRAVRFASSAIMT